MSEKLSTLEEVTWDQLYYIITRMRQADYDEIFATRWDDSSEAQLMQLANDCLNVVRLPTSISIVAQYEERPVAVLGAAQTWPHVWDVWAFGTDEFPKIASGLTKFVHRILIPKLLARGMRRAHCRSMVGHTRAHAWLRSFGAQDEVMLKSWGKNGEDFVLFEWHRDKLLKIYQPAEAA